MAIEKENDSIEPMIYDMLSIANYKVKKNFGDLRRKILLISGINEKVENNSIVYYKDKKFCSIKIKKDLLEIDFLSDKTFIDPIGFSWKIRSKELNQRMQLKNTVHLDMALGLLTQSLER